MDRDVEILQGDDNEMESFIIEDKINHPFFFWTNSLVSFDYDGNEREGILTDESGNKVPYQVYNRKIWFKASLACGEKKVYSIYEKEKPYDGLKYRENEDFYTVQNAGFSAVIPKHLTAKGECPAPVSRVAFLDTSIGDNIIEGSECVHMEAEFIAKGSLFAKIKVRYFFANGGTYEAVITIVFEYDFIKLDEKMDNAGEAMLCINGGKFRPEYRYDSTWPDSKWELCGRHYGDYNWRCADSRPDIPFNGEDPAFSSVYTEDGAIPMRLGPYMPFFAYSVRPAIAFWNGKGESVGFFVSDHENWDEGNYPIWGTGTKLDGRFYFENGFGARFAMKGKSRSIALAFYPRIRDEEWFAKLERLKDEVQKFGVSESEARKMTCYPTSYTAYLHNRYVMLDLNKVKDWVLEYDGDFPDIPFDGSRGIQSADELEHIILTSGRVVLGTKGVEEFHERSFTFDAVEIRMFYDKLVDGYLRLKDELTEKSRKRITALLLLSVYTTAGEESIPIRKMLGGHPNFLADMKAVCGLGAVMFPQHRDAKLFAGVFEESVRNNVRCHVRPDVKKWSARGGRWTEAPGIYTWAFLTPTLITNALLVRYFDGKDRFANKYTAALARYMINLMTPVIKGRRRIIPLGAHSELRTPFRIFELFAESISGIDKELSENMLAFCSNDDQPRENAANDVWGFLYQKKEKKYKEPDLKSAKYTGFGYILRDDVGQADESALFMIQLDHGPNYRWGIPSKGSCGTLYYYSKGKVFSHTGKEDAGDRKSEDTAYCTNFGVWKDGMYRSIGRHTLSYPFYMLDGIQYARLLPEKGYSTPEYVYRSVIKTPDYFVIYDAVLNESVATRFSWFTERDGDFPEIHFVKGYEKDKFAVKNYGFSEHITAQTKGRWYEGSGDRITVVSDKKLDIKDNEWGAVINDTDHVFMSARKLDICSGEVKFCGTTGFTRSGKLLAVIDGGEISSNGNVLVAENGAVSLKINENTVCGRCLGCRRFYVMIGKEKFDIKTDEVNYNLVIKNGKVELDEIKDKYPEGPMADKFNRNTVFTDFSYGNLSY